MSDGTRHTVLRKSTVEYPGASWTAFDRYGRYGALVRALRGNLGPGRWRVLDVGDSAGYLSIFDDCLDAVVLDVQLTDDPLAGAVRVVGDGSRLPFPDAAFDAVVSSDALEHVPPPARPAFLAELARASRDLVLLAAPFATPGVAGAEELIRRFALLVTGRPQDQLEEHREHGLPELAETEARLSSMGFAVRSAGTGNLFDWTTMMMLKHQLIARPALSPLDTGYDILYNSLLAGRNGMAPYYRHLVAARRSAPPETGSEPDPVEGTPPDVSGLMAAFLAANAAEAVRHDVNSRLSEVERRVDDLAASLPAAWSGLHQSLDRVTAAVTANGAGISQLHDLLRHPVRAFTAKVRRDRAGDTP